MRCLCPATFAQSLSFGSACLAMADGRIANNNPDDFAAFGYDASTRFATQGVC